MVKISNYKSYLYIMLLILMFIVTQDKKFCFLPNSVPYVFPGTWETRFHIHGINLLHLKVFYYKFVHCCKRLWETRQIIQRWRSIGITFISSFVYIGQMFQKLKGGTHRHSNPEDGDLIYRLLSIFKEGERDKHGLPLWLGHVHIVWKWVGKKRQKERRVERKEQKWK